MRTSRFAIVVVVLLASVLAVVAEAGNLMVTCRPGHRVYLDGDFAGLTTVDQDGLLIADVTAGNHAVRIEKQGFVPFESSVEVPGRGFAEIRVPRLEAALGAIRIVCDPGHRVYLDGQLMGLSDSDGLTVDKLPSGPVTIRVEKLDREAYEGRVEVVGGETVEVVVGPLEAVETDSEIASDGESAPGAAAGGAVAVVTSGSVGSKPGAPGRSATATERSETVATTAPEVLDQDASSLDTTAAATVAVASAEGFSLQREAPTPSDILFAYRAQGTSLARGGKVTVHRERGGPRAPVMVFWCVDQTECQNQTKSNFAPGSYRFRINCRLESGAGSVDADAFVDVDASSGHSYLVDVVFDDGCAGQLVDLSAATNPVS